MFLNMQFRILILSLIFNYVYCKVDVIVSVKPEDSAIHITNEKFFSVAYDTNGVCKNFDNFDMTNARFFKLLQQLAPGYMRVGGKKADRLIFSTEPTDNNIKDCDVEAATFKLAADDWVKFNDYIKKLNTKILFDLNSLLRHEDGSWDSENAEKIISFSAARNYDIDWTLSNEPNSHQHIYNYTIEPGQLAEDFSVLRNILNKYPQYKNSAVGGPDVTHPIRQSVPIERYNASQYIVPFLGNLSTIENPLDAITVHHYYLDAKNATVSDFLNPATYTDLERQINKIHEFAKKTNQEKLQIWLTETGSAHGGGAKNLSDRFVATFIWLDKLALSAKLGVDVVVRQSLVRINYALIDPRYYPNPDWWLSILYKKFVGHEVLNCNVQGPDTVRLYCQCHPSSQIPTITIFGINLANSPAQVQVKGIEKNEFSSSAYILTTENPNDLTTKNFLLNGVELKLSRDTGDLPEFVPEEVDISKPLTMPALSLAFWTVPTPDAAACTRRSVNL